MKVRQLKPIFVKKKTMASLIPHIHSEDAFAGERSISTLYGKDLFSIKKTNHQLSCFTLPQEWIQHFTASSCG
jgi:hypothetical protein